MSESQPLTTIRPRPLAVAIHLGGIHHSVPTLYGSLPFYATEGLLPSAYYAITPR